MRPDLLLFNEHVQDAVFQSGIDSGMWGIENNDPTRPAWPVVIIWVQAAQKPNSPEKYYFRFDLNGYPSTAPTACPWDVNSNNRLSDAQWPKGQKLVSHTFRPSWNPNALYAPCDRVAMVGHEGWQQQFPELWWQPSFKITIYLNFIHQLLNSSDYVNS